MQKIELDRYKTYCEEAVEDKMKEAKETEEN